MKSISQSGNRKPPNPSNNNAPRPANYLGGEMRMLGLSEVMKKTGLSRSSVYAYIAQGAFPAQVQLGPRRVAWHEWAIREWIFGLKTTMRRS